MRENKTNTLLLTVIGVATLLVAVIGATFAYFTAQVSGTESSTTITVTAGTLTINFGEETGSLTFNGEQVIPTQATTPCTFENAAVKLGGTSGTAEQGWYCAENLYTPIASKKFTLTGVNDVSTTQGGMKMPYTLELLITANGFSNGALKWTLNYENTGSTKNASDVFASSTAWGNINGTTKITLGSGSFGPQAGVTGASGRTTGDNVHSYVLRIFFPDNNIVQDTDKNRTFSALVNITSGQITAQ